MAAPKVIVLSEILRGQTYELTDELYTIGRSEEREICIPDGTVSTHHCSLVSSGNGTYIAQDQGSTNGTRINGVRITEQELSNSDILQVGGIEILFDSEDKTGTASLNTQTGINLEETAGGLNVSEMANVSPFQDGAGIKGDGAKGKLIWTAVIALLVLVVVVLLVVLVLKMLSGPGAA